MASIPQKHDPGGKVRLAISPDVKSSAVVFGGPNKFYRYQLRRTWDETKPHAMFIMMNPSIADLKEEDPSVAKCGRFARAWDYGGIYVGNTSAYRATDKKRLRVCDDPIGPENNKHLIEMAKLAKTVIFAYGQPGHRSLRDRGRLLAKILIDIMQGCHVEYDSLLTMKILGIRCPTCGAGPGEKCELSTALPRTNPHRDRGLIAADHLDS